MVDETARQKWLAWLKAQMKKPPGKRRFKLPYSRRPPRAVRGRGKAGKAGGIGKAGKRPVLTKKGLRRLQQALRGARISAKDIADLEEAKMLRALEAAEGVGVPQRGYTGSTKPQLMAPLRNVSHKLTRRATAGQKPVTVQQLVNHILRRHLGAFSEDVRASRTFLERTLPHQLTTPEHRAQWGRLFRSGTPTGRTALIGRPTKASLMGAVTNELRQSSAQGEITAGEVRTGLRYAAKRLGIKNPTAAVESLLTRAPRPVTPFTTGSFLAFQPGELEAAKQVPEKLRATYLPYQPGAGASPLPKMPAKSGAHLVEGIAKQLRRQPNVPTTRRGWVSALKRGVESYHKQGLIKTAEAAALKKSIPKWVGSGVLAVPSGPPPTPQAHRPISFPARPAGRPLPNDLRLPILAPHGTSQIPVRAGGALARRYVPGGRPTPLLEAKPLITPPPAASSPPSSTTPPPRVGSASVGSRRGGVIQPIVRAGRGIRPLAVRPTAPPSWTRRFGKWIGQHKLGLGLSLLFLPQLVREWRDFLTGDNETMRQFRTAQAHARKVRPTLDDLRTEMRLEELAALKLQLLQQNDPALLQVIMGRPETTASEAVIGAGIAPAQVKQRLLSLEGLSDSNDLRRVFAGD